MSEVYKGIKSILTAYWTKVKNYIDTKLSGKANSSHTHTKSQITDFPTSLPANGGNANTATNATNDGKGNNIVNTYMPKSGGTFTGTVKCSDSLIIPTSTPSRTGDGSIWIS